MKNKNKNKALALLWRGPEGKIFESLTFALFLFLFSFMVTTSPAEYLTPGVNVVVGTANQIGQGYEATIRRLDRNVVFMPEILVGINNSYESWQAGNRAAVRSVVAVYTSPPTKLVRWQKDNLRTYRRPLRSLE